MSQENVELIRRTHDAVNRTELDSSEIHRIASQLLHPDVEWHDQRELPGATVHHGVEGVERHLAAAREALDYHPAELLDLMDAGPRVVAVYRVHARGRASGVPVERDACYVYSFRGARIERVEIFGTKAEALEAAGLSEQTMSQEDAIRAGYKAFSDGDLEAFLETLDPEIELLTSGAFPDFEPAYRGYDGIRKFWEAFSGPWDRFDLEPERIVEGMDCAAVSVHFRGRGAGSGATTELKQGHAMRFRNGRTVKVSTHPSFEEALEAVGLSE